MNTLRTLFFGLLLINLVLFALGRGGLGSGQRGEPERLANQIAPERIRLVGPDDGPAATAPGVPSPPAVAVKPETRPAAAACHKWEGLPREQAQRIAELAGAAELKAELVTRIVGEPTSFWVYLPPAADPDAVQKRVAELKQAGVSEYFVVQEKGPLQLAISLGLFNSRGPANTLVETMRGKGIADAEIEERGAATTADVDIRGPEAALAAALTKIAAELPDAPGIECPAR